MDEVKKITKARKEKKDPVPDKPADKNGIEKAMQNLLLDTSWHNLALFAHGATNAAILGWVTGIGRSAFGVLDQAMCCLNVVDIDFDESGAILRKTVRAMNITADDPAKSNRHGGDMESLAHRLSLGTRDRNGTV